MGFNKKTLPLPRIFAPFDFNIIHIEATMEYLGIPLHLDWNERGFVTTPESQGRCGACYIFSSETAVESRCAINGWPLLRLSRQSLLDCLPDQSCTKGFQSHVYQWGKDFFSAIVFENSFLKFFIFRKNHRQKVKFVFI